MKKLVIVAVVFVFLFAVVGTAMAAKPADNLAGAQKVAWNLSAAVMPVPLYGSGDILGSDTASKLIVNQPKGKTKVTITGVMKGLTPNTTYTVLLSNGYTKYVTGWNVVGTWMLRLHFGASIYDHDVVINVQSDGTFTGTGGYPAGGSPYINTETITGTIDMMSGIVTIHSVYNTGYIYDATGIIAPNGTMSGNWTGSGQPTYTWESISGQAKTHTGSTGWPGLFTSTVQPFTFTTNAHGSGSWHINLKDSNFPEVSGPYTLSVWINAAGATILISDTFTVVSH